MAGFEAEAYRLAGRSFNLGSPKQLGEVLFDELNLGGAGRKTKTGAYATGVEVLEELAVAGHELPRVILNWRQLQKLTRTYTDTLVEQVNPDTGRVHTCYSLAATSTGRLSSNDPNLQNIPIRTEEGRKIREAFVAEAGYVLVSADYSQIELRILAHIADIGTLKEAFAKDIDIHAVTASQMFGVPVAEVGSDLRRSAKTINYGIVYGIGAFGLAQRLGIPQAQAKAYIDSYFEQYPGIRAYMDKAKAEAREKGYVTTLYGRRCYVPEINVKLPSRRAYAERAAINAPIQGTAADIMKRAMIRTWRDLKRELPEVRMLLQVHDELVFEVPEAAGRGHAGAGEADDGAGGRDVGAAGGRGRARGRAGRRRTSGSRPQDAIERQPRRAASIAATSIFLMPIMASNARFASSPPAASASVSTRGVICQEIPHLSLHQPQALSWPPLPTMAFQ